MVVVPWGLSSCGAWPQLLCGLWSLPRSGIKPMSPAVADVFLTTGLPGPRSGIKPMSPAVADVFLTTGLPGNSFSIVSFDVLNLKKFHEVQFLNIFFFVTVPLISYPSYRCQIQCHSICSVPLFCFFVCFNPTFKCLIHFESIFIHGIS